MSEKRNLAIKRQQETPGAIVEIPIKDFFVYAQILTKGIIAVFDKLFISQLKDLTELQNLPVLFRISVYKDVITHGKWLKIGKLPIREDLKTHPMNYIQDPIKKESFSIYNPNTGEIVPCSKKDIIGLECAAVWEKNHLEDRIAAYYNHEPCILLKQQYELFGKDYY